MQRVILAVFILGLVVSSAFAQGAGQVNGVVADTGGGVIPGVTVIAVATGRYRGELATYGRDFR